MTHPLRPDLVAELTRIVRSKSPAEIAWAISPVLRLCSVEIAHLTTDTKISAADIHAIATEVASKQESEQQGRSIVCLFDWGDNESRTLADRSRSAAEALGIGYDAFRRKGADGTNRVNKLISVIADQLLESSELDEATITSVEAEPTVTRQQTQVGMLFQSYSHEDDEHEDEFFSKIRQATEREFLFQTGLPLRIFQDKVHIELGENWQRKLDREIDGTKLLLVFLTPSYLASEACRRELERFFERERMLGREDLVLTIYYQALPPDSVSDDPLAVRLLERQYTDWRPLRFATFSSLEVKKEIASLVTSIRSAFARIGTEAETTNIENDEDEPEDMSNGMLEILAEMEFALPRYLRSVEAMTATQTKVAKITKSRTLELDRPEAGGRSAARSLLVARKLATDLEPIALEMEDTRESMYASMAAIDSGVKAFADGIITSSEEDILEQANSFLDAIARAYEAISGAEKSVVRLRDACDDLGKKVRALRPVLKRIGSAVMIVADHRNTFGEWAERIQDAISERQEEVER